MLKNPKVLPSGRKKKARLLCWPASEPMTEFLKTCRRERKGGKKGGRGRDEMLVRKERQVFHTYAAVWVFSVLPQDTAVYKIPPFLLPNGLPFTSI